MEAKPFVVALILGGAFALFLFRDKAAAWYPSGEHLPPKLGVWMVQMTIALLAVIALALMVSD